MRRSYAILTGLIAIVLIAGGFILIGNKDEDNSGQDDTTSSVPSSQNPDASNSPVTAPESVVTITYTDGGFSSSSVSIKSGEGVTFKNDSNSDVQIQSDPHPIHTDNPQLNVGLLKPGQSATITVTKKGNNGFHNHLNETERGIIAVQ